MLRKALAALAAAAVFATSFAPVDAAARDRDRRGYYDRDYRHDGYRRHHRDHDDDGDAVAAGVVGLVLGLAIGSLASQPREPQARCRDNYQRCGGPPPRYYRDRDYDYDDDRDYEERRGSAYEDEYGLEGGRYYEEGSYDPGPQRGCTIQQRRWDQRSGRYVIVEVPRC